MRFFLLLPAFFILSNLVAQDVVTTTLDKYDFSSPVFKSIYDYEIFARGKLPDLNQQSVQYKSGSFASIPNPGSTQPMNAAQSISDPYIAYFEKSMERSLKDQQNQQEQPAINVQ